MVNAPRIDLLGVGLAFLLLGSVGAAGLLPLAFIGLDTVKIFNVEVQVTGSNEAVYTAQISNNWNTTRNIDVWAQIKNPEAVIVSGPFKNTLSMSAFETQTVGRNMGMIPPRTQVYTLELFAWLSGPDAILLAPINYKTFNVAVPITVTIFIGPGDGGAGTSNPPPGTYEISSGDSITVIAIPDPDAQFNNFMVDEDGRLTQFFDTNPITYTPTKNVVIQPGFVKELQRTLKIRLSPEFAGGTNPGTSNPSPGTYAYTVGQTVTLTAIPDQGWEVNFWGVVNPPDESYRVYGETTIEVTMNWDTTVTLYFLETPLAMYDVSVSVFPQGAGDTFPASRLLPYSYVKDFQIEFNAFPFSGWDFSYWEINGEVISEDRNIIVTVNQDLDIIGYFKELPDEPDDDDPDDPTDPPAAGLGWLTPVFLGIGAIATPLSFIIKGGRRTTFGGRLGA